MKKQRAVMLGAAVVLAISLIGGGSYAWFTARAEDPNLGGLDGSNRNGIRGGIVAGAVDLKVSLESYTAFTDGTRITELGEYPGLLYPEDVVVLPQDTTMADGRFFPAGTILDGTDPNFKVKSVIEYVVENTSQIDILAQVNQKGLSIDDAVNGSVANPIDHVFLNVSKLLGSEILDTDLDDLYGMNNYRTGAYYASKDEFYEDGPTWFYWANGPDGNKDKFVNHRKLEKYGFLEDGNIYNINALAKTFISTPLSGSLSEMMKGTPFYAAPDTTKLISGTTVNGVELKTAIDTRLGVQGTECVVATSDANYDHENYMYLYMPAGGKTSVKFELSLPDYVGAPGSIPNEVNIKGNEYQYAVFSLAFDPNNTDSAGDKLIGFGVQANKAAINDFFGLDLYDDLTTTAGAGGARTVPMVIGYNRVINGVVNP